MTKIALKTCVSAAGIVAALWVAPAYAQDAAPAAADDAAGGDDIVVTASTGDRSRFRTSSSISQVDQDAILNFTPRSEAEVLRNIPGLNVQDTAGPGGNANIGVRGIPVSTGGSEYVALQEDGLPVTLFGDIQFGNNDYWLRFDTTVDRVEAVRGGTASTFASQAPGAVINYISRTGREAGGEIAISRGVDFRETRFDFNYGAPITETLRFNIGGYAREGGGPTNESFNILRGYQLKANITQDFAEGRGYVRLLFKRLDERAPTFTTMPSLATLNNGVISDFQPLPTFDSRDGSNYSIYNRSFQFLRFGGQGVDTASIEGIHPTVTSLGAQFHYELMDNIVVDNNFRFTDMRGNFTTQFLSVATRASVIGSVVNGSTVGSIRYANGPSQGQLYTGTYVNNNPNINTIIHDMGSIANNLTVSGNWDVGEGRVRATAGWFHMSQNIVQDWHVNRSYAELSGNNPAQLNLFSTTGTQLTAAGQAGFNDNWGNCCARSVDLAYTNDAPFLSLGYANGGLDLDASVRFDSVKAEGTAQGGIAGPNTTVTDAVGSAVLPSLVAGGPIEVLNYRDSYTSWSIGALYAFNPNLTVFARASRGGRFNADRRTLGGNFNADGSLNRTGAATSINFINQQEIGVKFRGRIGDGGSFSTETTLFRSTLTENNFDFTRINNPAPNNDPNISNSYRTYGVEFTGRLSLGGFRLAADITYTKSEITASVTPAFVGNTPRTIPALTYLISPSYDAGIAEVGFSLNGQSSTELDDFNSARIEGQTFVNAFLKIRPVERVELGLNVNNLFNTLGYRGSGSTVPVSGNQVIFQNSAVTGRTISASVRYRF